VLLLAGCADQDVNCIVAYVAEGVAQDATGAAAHLRGFTCGEHDL
jgi:hypothetical protein